jgi:hypothetical protein
MKNEVKKKMTMKSYEVVVPKLRGERFSSDENDFCAAEMKIATIFKRRGERTAIRSRA